MSIYDVLDYKVRQQMLFPLWPARQGDSARRALLLSGELNDALHTMTDHPDWEARRGALRADLEFFVTSPTIDPKYLFHLYPARDCIWEIRSVRENPSIRVLGAFAAKDVFIATTFTTREALGGWQSREWRTIKRRASAQWRTLLQPYKPVFGTSAAIHITGALTDAYFRDRA